MTSTDSDATLGLAVDQALVTAVIQGTNAGLQMAGVEPTAVGASRLGHSNRKIGVMVGLVGLNNGTILVNMSERAMLFLAGKMLFEDQSELNEDNIDAICEIGNMIAGCTKEALDGSDYEISNISVPSMILGAAYDIHYTRGIDTVSVEFEVSEMPFSHYQDRFISVTISLLRRVA